MHAQTLQNNINPPQCKLKQTQCKITNRKFLLEVFYSVYTGDIVNTKFIWNKKKNSSWRILRRWKEIRVRKCRAWQSIVRCKIKFVSGRNDREGRISIKCGKECIICLLWTWINVYILVWHVDECYVTTLAANRSSMNIKIVLTHTKPLAMLVSRWLVKYAFHSWYGSLIWLLYFLCVLRTKCIKLHEYSVRWASPSLCIVLKIPIITKYS
jgi:hypothetical protein